MANSGNDINKKIGVKMARPVLLVAFLFIGFILLYSATVVANGDDGHMGGDHMMDWDWFGIPFMWFWMGAIWLVFIVIAFLIYKDAERRDMNGLLWFVLVILPWIGILFLIIYLIIREGKSPDKLTQKSPSTILDERYAKGEITREDYQRMKKDIKIREFK